MSRRHELLSKHLTMSLPKRLYGTSPFAVHHCVLRLLDRLSGVAGSDPCNSSRTWTHKTSTSTCASGTITSLTTENADVQNSQDQSVYEALIEWAIIKANGSRPYNRQIRTATMSYVSSTLCVVGRACRIVGYLVKQHCAFLPHSDKCRVSQCRDSTGSSHKL